MSKERMKFLVDEVNSLTKKKQEMKENNIPLWNWPNEEGRLIKMYVDEIALLKEQNNKEEIKVATKEGEMERKMDRIPTELELLGQLINNLKKKEETEMDKKIIYDITNKVWMEEGAQFRQISQKDFYNEIKRIRKVFSKLSTREESPINTAKKYTFNDRGIFVKLLNNMKRGGYVVIRKDSTSITLGKEWYSFGMRANYYHSLEFSKSKDGEYVIGDIRDRRLLKDKSKRKKYGSRELPIR